MSFTKPQAQRLTQRLSPREREILRLMGDGLPTKAIAAQLTSEDGRPLSTGTVNTYRSRIFLKLGVNSVGPAIRVATLAGL